MKEIQWLKHRKSYNMLSHLIVKKQELFYQIHNLKNKQLTFT